MQTEFAAKTKSRWLILEIHYSLPLFLSPTLIRVTGNPIFYLFNFVPFPRSTLFLTRYESYLNASGNVLRGFPIVRFLSPYNCASTSRAALT